MKKVLCILFTVGLMSVASRPVSAQTDVEIGKTVIRIQSPIEIQDRKSGNVDGDKCEDTDRKQPRLWAITNEDLYFGFSFPVPGCNYEQTPDMPVQYGNSFEIHLGYRPWFRLSRHYALGLSVEYSHYDYRTTGLLPPGMITSNPVNGQITREIFKTDNIGTGVYNRFVLTSRWPGLHIDLGVWGDWAFSRQYKVKYMVAGNKEVDHFRDGARFLPLQGGLYGAVGVGAFSVYCKYRFSNLFNHSYIAMEPPRMSIGLVISLSDLF